MTDPSPQNKKDGAQEIEIKLKLSPTDHSTLKSWLLKNTKPGAVQHQTDLYFENPHSPFFKPDSHGHIQALKYFRLRSIPNGPCFLTFKDWDTPASSAGDRLFCYEHETEVSNKEHMLKIITSLGYTTQYSLQKKRSHFYHTDFELAVDQITELGTFLEIEVKKRKFPDPASERHRLIQLVDQIGLIETTLVKRGYILQLFDQ